MIEYLYTMIAIKILSFYIYSYNYSIFGGNRVNRTVKKYMVNRAFIQNTDELLLIFNLQT